MLESPLFDQFIAGLLLLAIGVGLLLWVSISGEALKLSDVDPICRHIPCVEQMDDGTWLATSWPFYAYGRTPEEAIANLETPFVLGE